MHSDKLICKWPVTGLRANLFEFRGEPLVRDKVYAVRDKIHTVDGIIAVKLVGVEVLWKDTGEEVYLPADRFYTLERAKKLVEIFKKRAKED